jgi:hypothetical protein
VNPLDGGVERAHRQGDIQRRILQARGRSRSPLNPASASTIETFLRSSADGTALARAIRDRIHLTAFDICLRTDSVGDPHAHERRLWGGRSPSRHLETSTHKGGTPNSSDGAMQHSLPRPLAQGGPPQPRDLLPARSIAALQVIALRGPFGGSLFTCRRQVSMTEHRDTEYT